MGCCSSSTLKYEHAGKYAAPRSTSSSSLLLSSPEWTYLSKEEMAQLLNKINLVPFPEKRKKVLLSVKSRLLTYDDFCSILSLIPTDEEKFVVLQMLFGNISSTDENLSNVVQYFQSPTVQQEVTNFISTRQSLK